MIFFSRWVALAWLKRNSNFLIVKDRRQRNTACYSLFFIFQPADVYLIDEPSAYLDSEQRLVAAKVIKRWVFTNIYLSLVFVNVIYFCGYCLEDAGMAQWWEHSSPTNVARVRFPDPASYVGWVCWFSALGSVSRNSRELFIWGPKSKLSSCNPLVLKSWPFNMFLMQEKARRLRSLMAEKPRGSKRYKANCSTRKRSEKSRDFWGTRPWIFHKVN
mgnify:CR=1 FL=1